MLQGGPGALPRRVGGGSAAGGGVSLEDSGATESHGRPHSLEGGQVDSSSQKGRSKGKPSRQHGQNQYLMPVSSSFFLNDRRHKPEVSCQRTDSRLVSSDSCSCLPGFSYVQGSRSRAGKGSLTKLRGSLLGPAGIPSVPFGHHPPDRGGAGSWLRPHR